MAAIFIFEIRTSKTSDATPALFAAIGFSGSVRQEHSDPRRSIHRRPDRQPNRRHRCGEVASPKLCSAETQSPEDKDSRQSTAQTVKGANSLVSAVDLFRQVMRMPILMNARCETVRSHGFISMASLSTKAIVAAECRRTMVAFAAVPDFSPLGRRYTAPESAFRNRPGRTIGTRNSDSFDFGRELPGHWR